MDNLPHLVLERVFSFLDVQASCSMRLVCSTFNQIFLQFRNPNFKNSLHYVQLDSDQKLRLFLSTFSEAEVPIPFPRFLWNVYIGSDAEVNDLGTLYASTMVELSIIDQSSGDIFDDRIVYELCKPFSPKESLKRLSTFLHLVGSTLEVLGITLGFFDDEMSVEEFPVPVLPKLSILEVQCTSSIDKWMIEDLVRKAPVLEFVTRRQILLPFDDLHYELAVGPNVTELEYYPEDDQSYSEEWFLANARRYRRLINPPFKPGKGITKTFIRLWNDQVRNFEALMSVTPVLLDRVYPRVQSLFARVSAFTWLDSPLTVLSPTKLPRLRRVILKVYTNNFQAELSYVYPTVVELFVRVYAASREAYEPLPYYKLFPNVTTLKLDHEVTRNLIGLLNHFPKVCYLIIQYGDFFNRNQEDHDFDLECGAKPDVSFKHLERLEYRCLDGSEDVMLRLIRSAKASMLPKLKSVHLWNMVPRETLLGGATTREYGQTLKELELPNVTQLQEFVEVKWWFRKIGSVPEQLV